MWFSKELKMGFQIVSNYLYIFLYTFRLQYQPEIGYRISPIQRNFLQKLDSLCPKFLIESKA